MRDILAALLRDRGYAHDDSNTDEYWYSPTLGVRPLMVCVQWELDREKADREKGKAYGAQLLSALREHLASTGQQRV